MKCKLCNRNRALVKAKIGEAITDVCLYCAITEKLEVVEVLDKFEEYAVKSCLEERSSNEQAQEENQMETPDKD